MTSIAEALVSLLRARGQTLAVAESLTGGALAAEIVSVPGASQVLRGGIVAYATPVKNTLLEVDRGLLERHGAVHPEVARQMARGVRRALAVDGASADVGLSTTGIAGPESPDGQPVGTVHIGISVGEQTASEAFSFSGGRAEIRSASVDAALGLAVRILRSEDVGGRGRE